MENINSLDEKTINAARLGDPEAAAKCTKAGVAIPCPFCGGVGYKVHSTNSDLYSVQCLKGCYAETPISELYVTMEGALAAWNHRADLRGFTGPHWIPCSTKMPDKDGDYLVFNDAMGCDKWQSVMGFKDGYFKELVFTPSREACFVNALCVTHWMNLPEEPEEDSSCAP